MTAPGGWRRSSYCAAGDCIEVKAAAHPGLLYLRISLDGQPGRTTIAVTRSELAAFKAGLAAGEFDDLVTP